MNRTLTTAIVYQIILTLLLYLLLLLLPTELRADTGIVIGSGAHLPRPPDRVEPPEENYANRLYLPVITTAATSEPSCQLRPEEEQMATLITTAPDQQRPHLVCNTRLTAIARARAEDMARRAYFAHTNPDGYGPNYLAQQSGYQLPTFYDQSATGNNIESIGAGSNSAAAMWQAWLDSDHHATHVLGTADFFREQSDYGIGFASLPGSPYQFYWVMLSAKPG
jgi:uncharacterized protein YkwD